MTLRVRLILGLVLLVLTGLAIFGYATYALYSRSQYDRLDDQLRTSIPTATAQLYTEASIGGGPGPSGGRPVVLPFGTFTELRNADRTLSVQIRYGDFEAEPVLPAVIEDPGRQPALFTTGSTVGSGEWRVSLSRAPGADGLYVVVAIPTSEVTESLNRLLVIELITIGVLLLILAIGAWLILRRGLRPLEQMATSTKAITAGDLSRRVEPADGRTEVGELGLAINTMLDEIESAFNERDATERRLRQFLADASHELRTPLTSIQGFAELFRLGADHPDLDLPLVMRRIEQESGRMGVLVDDLLTLARLDQQRPVQRRPVDVTLLAADVCSDARAAAPDRPISIAADGPVVVDGDGDHLRRAISNLVTNATRHTPPQSPVFVSVGTIDGTAVVAVRDRGPGLSTIALAHAFDRFWQEDPARSGAGSGLGLAIVAGIAAEHEGTVTATNAPGGGALFELRLPQRPAGSRSV